jgi:hypothetical protein
VRGQTFAPAKFAPADPRDFVWTRGQRRNVSKGQQAIAFALLWPEPEKGGRGKKGKASETDGFSATRYKQARAIVAHSREMAFAVRFRCESCGRAHMLTVAQHKGNTLCAWR